MTHASLFSGIGGFDLAAEWAGWTNMFNCEIDGFCRKVLKNHFPDAQQYADIRTTDFAVWRGSIDVLTGGFPCQPFSVAGKRLGTEDDRHLWPEMLRAVREVRPRWVVGENVPGIISWSNGLVFKQACADLENEGYRVGAFVLPACAVDAPHRRDRVWIIANSNDTRAQDSRGEWLVEADAGKHATYPDGERCEEYRSSGQSECPQERNSPGSGAERRIPDWNGFPTVSPVCGGDDGISAELDGITFPT